MFDVFPVTNINDNTYYLFDSLQLEHGQTYFAWVIGKIFTD